MKGIATLVGVLGTAASASGRMAIAPGEDLGSRAMYVFAGYHPTDNEPKKVISRLFATYGPLIAGVAVSKAASRLGVNRTLPKGINL